MSVDHSHSDNKNKIIRSIDIHNIEYNDKGVIDFYWPLDNKSASKVMESVTRDLIPFITEYKKQNSELLAISLLFKWFLCEVLRIFESALLASQFKKNNIIPVVPKNYKKFSAFYKNSQRNKMFTLFQGNTEDKLKALKIAEELADKSTLPILRKGLRDISPEVVEISALLIRKFK